MSEVMSGKQGSDGMSEAESAAHGYRVVLRYDGRGYYGWQRLRDHPTIQAALERAITRAFGEGAPVIGAGRTDRGAHAEGQVAGFHLSQEVSPEKVIAGLNLHLPADIRVLAADAVPLAFHARTSALGKIYHYRIATRAKLLPEDVGRVWHLPRKALDVPAMAAAARGLMGAHDFATFATKSRFARGTTVRNLEEASVGHDGEDVVFQFQAESFLYHMVRNVVRALFKVGEGRWTPERVAEILAAHDRAASPGSAPASGLYLMRVIYGPLSQDLS